MELEVMLPARYDRLTRKERRAVREAYCKLQNGLCYHCGGPLEQQPPKEIQEKKIDLLLFPFGFLTNPIHLHHSHDTGMTLGAVHARCNAVLWQYYEE